MKTGARYAVVNAVAILVGGGLVVWIAPTTNDGKILIVAAVVALLNGAAAAFDLLRTALSSADQIIFM